VVGHAVLARRMGRNHALNHMGNVVATTLVGVLGDSFWYGGTFVLAAAATDVAKQAGDSFANLVVANVRHGMKRRTASTTSLNDPLAAGRPKVAGATYDLTTDNVLLLRS
jgi:hypothetical protein